MRRLIWQSPGSHGPTLPPMERVIPGKCQKRVQSLWHRQFSCLRRQPSARVVGEEVVVAPIIEPVRSGLVTVDSKEDLRNACTARADVAHRAGLSRCEQCRSAQMGRAVRAAGITYRFDLGMSSRIVMGPHTVDPTPEDLSVAVDDEGGEWNAAFVDMLHGEGDGLLHELRQAG